MQRKRGGRGNGSAAVPHGPAASEASIAAAEPARSEGAAAWPEVQPGEDPFQFDDWQPYDDVGWQDDQVGQEPPDENKESSMPIQIRGRPVSGVFPSKEETVPSNNLRPKEVELGWGGAEVLNKTAKDSLRKKLRAKARASMRTTKEATRQDLQQCQELSSTVLQRTFDVPPEELRVVTGQPWASIHLPHTLRRCDVEMLCSSCG